MKLSKKVAAAAMATLLAMSMTVSAFAETTVSGNSPTQKVETIAKGTTAVVAKESGNVSKVSVNANGEATVRAVANKKTVTLGEVEAADGKVAEVVAVGANVFKGKKTKTIVVASKKINFKKNAFNGSKIKKIDLSAIKNAKNITFNKKCKIKKGAVVILSKKAYKNKALKRALKKLGVKIQKAK